MQIKKNLFTIMLGMIGVLGLVVTAPVFAQDEDLEVVTNVLQDFHKAAGQGDVEGMRQQMTASFAKDFNLNIFFGFTNRLAEVPVVIFQHTRFEIISVEQKDSHMVGIAKWFIPNAVTWENAIDTAEFNPERDADIEAFVTAVRAILTAGGYPVDEIEIEMMLIEENGVWKIDGWFLTFA